MIVRSMRERTAVAGNLRRAKQGIAESVTEAFLQRHPDWVERYGERARSHGLTDACYHIDFLAGAVEAGSFRPFEDYVRWTVRTLQARGISGHFVAENLEEIGRTLTSTLNEDDAAYIAPLLSAGVDVCREGSQASPADALAESMTVSGALFLQSILKGERKAALAVALEAHREGVEPYDLYVDMFQRSLNQLGELWQAGKISVAEEHMGTAITQFVIAQLYPLLPFSTRSYGKAIIAGVDGEFHQIGAHMVADMLEADGWDARFLGSNMPHVGILEALEEFKPKLLCISCTMTFNISKVVSLIEDVRAQKKWDDTRILLGGGAFKNAPLLYQELGAEGCGLTLRDAVALARGLT